MLNLESIIEKTRAKVREMNGGDPSCDLNSTQVSSLAAVLVEEINAEIAILSKPHSHPLPIELQRFGGR